MISSQVSSLSRFAVAAVSGETLQLRCFPGRMRSFPRAICLCFFPFGPLCSRLFCKPIPVITFVGSALSLAFLSISAAGFHFSSIIVHSASRYRALYFSGAIRSHAADSDWPVHFPFADFQFLWNMKLLWIGEFVSEMHQFENKCNRPRANTSQVLARVLIPPSRRHLLVSFNAPAGAHKLCHRLSAAPDSKRLIEEHRINLFQIDEVLDMTV